MCPLGPIVHLLTGLARPSTQGVSHMYDLRTMEVKREPVVPEPRSARSAVT
jgi:hypothetical protein